jgi:hypothetical protein
MYLQYNTSNPWLKKKGTEMNMHKGVEKTPTLHGYLLPSYIKIRGVWKSLHTHYIVEQGFEQEK